MKPLHRLPSCSLPRAGAAPLAAGGEPFAFPGEGPATALLVHGWTGAPIEVRPLGERLCQRGIASIGIRLPGHGTSAADLARYRRSDWLAATRTAYRRLADSGQQVVIIGHSMGGLLALQAAAEFAGDSRLIGLATLAAPVWLAGWHPDTLHHIRRLRQPASIARPDVQNPAMRHLTLSSGNTPISAFIQLWMMARETLRLLPRVEAPILVAQGAKDQVVPRRGTKLLYAGVSSPDRTLRLYPASGHNVALDYDADSLADDIQHFIARLSRRRAAI